jgi:hypothetical protein
LNDLCQSLGNLIVTCCGICDDEIEKNDDLNHNNDCPTEPEEDAGLSGSLESLDHFEISYRTSK